MRRSSSIAVELIKSDTRSFYSKALDIYMAADYRRRRELLKVICENNILKSKFFNTFQRRDLSELSNVKLFYNKQIEEDEILRTAAKLIDACYVSLSKFNDFRKEYERCLVRNDLPSAKITLDNIENEVGVSIWGIGQRLLIGGLDGSINDLWRTYVDQIAGQDTVLFLIDHLKIYADSNISTAKYYFELDKHLSNAAADVKRYMKAKLEFDRLLNKEDVSVLLQIDLQISIIDFYLSFEKCILSMGDKIFRNDDLININGIFPTENPNSTIIRNAELVLGLTEDVCTQSSYKENFGIIERYTQGEYENVICSGIDYLRREPQDFQIACIVCKSYIYANRKLDKSVLPLYMAYVFSIYSLDDNCERAGLELQNEMRLFYGISLSSKIRSFLERKNIIDKGRRFCFASFLLDEIVNPNCLKQISISRAESIKRFFEPYCEKSSNTIMGMILGRLDYCSLNSDPIRNQLTIVQCLCNNSSGQDIEEELHKLKQLCKNKNLYFTERYLQLELLYYKNSGKYLQAVSLLVDAFYLNRKIFARILDKSLFQLNYRTKDRLINRNINHILLTYLMYPSETRKQIIVYNNLLDSYGFSDVLQCISMCKGADRKKWEYFLREICTTELLRNDDRLYSSGLSPEQARISILKQLIKISRCKDDWDELFELKKKESIQNKLKKIKSGKVFVDTERIFEACGEEWDETLKSFIRVKESNEVFSYIDYPVDENSLQLFSNNRQLIIKTNSRENQMHRLMGELIARISHELLYHPQYGLETFLSARIRHGYVRGLLVTFLQELDLIAIYDQELNSYKISSCWGNICKSDSEYKIVYDALVNFTNQIEEKVNEILNEWLHIKTNEYAHGMFDYEVLFSDRVITEYLKIMETPNNIRLFYRDVVDTFWDLTEDILESIRKRIEDELQKYYIDKIQFIADSVHSYETDTSIEAFRELNHRCQKAKTNTILTLQHFKEAFVHQNTSYQDFTLEELGQCVKRTVCEQYKTEDIKWKIVSDEKQMLNGRFFLPFVDILCILVNNAINHSGIQEKKFLQIGIEMKLVKKDELNQDAVSKSPELNNHERYVTISVKNNLLHSLDTDVVNRKLGDVFTMISRERDAQDYTQREGGTGLCKLCNIIEYQINWLYFIEYVVKEHAVTIGCVICADKLMKGD